MKITLLFLAVIMLSLACTRIEPASLERHNKCKEQHKKLRAMGLKY